MLLLAKLLIRDDYFLIVWYTIQKMTIIELQSIFSNWLHGSIISGFEQKQKPVF